MVGTASSWRQVGRVIVFAAAAVVVRMPGLGCAHAAEAVEASATAPKIVGVRIGLKNVYKLGCWTPVAVEVANAAAGLHINVEVVDSDGVPTTATSPVGGTTVDGRRRAVVYTQAGRVGSPIRVALANEERVLDVSLLAPNGKADSTVAIQPLPATTQVVLSVATTPWGAVEALPDRAGGANQVGRRLIELNGVEQLPDVWYGYDAVDIMMLSVGDGKLIRELAGNEAKFSALRRWIELGGRLVILCGGENAEAMMRPGGPLETLVPGKFADMVRLTEPGSLEHFARERENSIAPIGGAAIQIPRLTDVEGNVDAYVGRRPRDLPLVVRSPRGFGEVTFSAVEFFSPPLSAWPGKTAFIRSLLRPYLADPITTDSSQQLRTSGFNDLSGALRQQLGRGFSGVAPLGFPIVTGLVIAYLFVLGPLDYLLVTRWLRRPLVAWITFPLIVGMFTALAYGLGQWSRGPNITRVNQLQLVDVDTANGQARGILWSVVYSPKAKRFDVGVKVQAPKLNTSAASEVLLGWWGLPGMGIGGMLTGGADWAIVAEGYEFGANNASLKNAPVLTAATKSFVARWTGSMLRTFSSQLSEADGLVTGSLTNETGVVLRNARLLYGSWAYKLGTLNMGERVEISEALSPRRAKTIVTRDALGESEASSGPAEGRVFSADRAAPIEILNLMMFYETAGGYGFAHLPNRYQAYCDMSRQLELGRAVLVADGVDSSTQVIDESTALELGGSEVGSSTTVYRFVLPVARASGEK